MKWPFVTRRRFDATVVHYKEAVDHYAAENALLWEKNDRLAKRVIDAEDIDPIGSDQFTRRPPR